MQPFQCDLQPEIPKQPITTHTQADPKQLQATITLRQKKRQTDRSRNRRTHEVPFIAGCSHFTRKNTRFRAPAPPQNRAHYTAAKKKGKPTAAATAAHMRYLSSPAAATLHGKTQGFVLRLPPHNIAHATFMQPFQCDLQPQIQEMQRTTHTASRTTSPLPIVTNSLRHHFPSSPLPFVTTSLPHHFPSSPPPIVPTSLPHHSPSSPLPSVTISLHHHFPSSPLSFLTTPLHHHFPSSPLPFLATSHRPHLPSSPLPFLTTSLRHHFPSSPLPIVPTSLPHHPPSLPFVTTSLPHHFPSSPPPIVPTSLPHHSASSPLPFVTTSLPHHFPSSPPPIVPISLPHLDLPGDLGYLPAVPHKAVAEDSKIGNL